MKLEVKKVESQSLPGFRYIHHVYRGREGWTRPHEEVVISSRQHFLLILYYLFSIKEHINITHTPTLNSNKPSLNDYSPPT